MTDINIEQTFHRISSKKGVKGVLILTNPEGLIIKSSLSEELSKLYSKTIKHLVEVATKSVIDIDEQDDLKFLRVRTSKHEILISPDNEFLLVVIQDPNEALAA